MINAVHHAGVTVADLDRSVTFWSGVLEREPLWRRMLDAPYLADVTGYSGCRIEVAMFELSSDMKLELLRYEMPAEAATAAPNGPETARPGNVHLAFTVADIAAVWSRALSLGATATSAAPVRVTSGANEGALAAYLRDPDGVTIELIQPREI